ncbi:MAG TPA: alpha/beta fold hydrolase [Xanthomonadales bacterium]|nr:alpha/beta fold hydrolase [Xanthomonadales bacterium]
MFFNPRALLRHILLFFGYGLLGAFVTMTVVFLVTLEKRPDLEPWHTADLDEEFTAESDIHDLESYLRLEDRLFGQLDRLVYDKTGAAEDDLSNRFKRGSLTDPNRWSTNWNRTFEFPSDAPTAVVLLIHGLSDSPYSMRSIGMDLHEAGAQVLGLRVPGHGTSPSALVPVHWRDMAAAVRLAMVDLSGRFPGVPIHIVGYSNGAALAVNYALSSVENEQLPKVDRIVLLSPQIGVTSLAAFAVWQARLGYLLGLDKVAWNEILPEYDPFKYGSFAVNAGDVSYRITVEIQRQLDVLDEENLLALLPPILAFSSVVDATVRATDLVNHLFDRLERGDHELVIYDVNRMVGIRALYDMAPQALIDAVQKKIPRNFSLSILTNVNSNSRFIVARDWPAGSSSFGEEPLGVAWPEDVFSLSHVALPFPADDPLYGRQSGVSDAGITLGNLAFRGERGTLLVTPAAMLRQRSNPFYDYQQQRIQEFLGLR